MTRQLIPRFDFGRWCGAGVSEDDVEGWSLLIEWLGLAVEIAVGRVKP